MTPIYDCCGRGLGDVWATVNYLAHEAQRTGGVRAHMSAFIRSNGLGGDGFWSRDGAQIEEILACLAIPERLKPIISPFLPTATTGMAAWAKPYFPTKTVWQPGQRRAIGYQFDGISSAEDKNPSLAEVDQFLDWAIQHGVKAVKLGRPLTLAACIDALTKVDLFVGACSGLSHVAISVGLPVHLLEYKVKVFGCYQLDKVIIHQGIIDFLSTISKAHSAIPKV